MGSSQGVCISAVLDYFVNLWCCASKSISVHLQLGACHCRCCFNPVGILPAIPLHGPHQDLDVSCGFQALSAAFCCADIKPCALVLGGQGVLLLAQ